MKALIENIQHFSLHDGPGTRTTLFFKGCPLKCVWCSNPTTQSFEAELLFKMDQCLACGTCAAKCPQNALDFTEGQKPTLNRDLCKNCGLCVSTCTGRALVMAGKSYTVDEAFKIIKKDILFYQNSNGGVTFSGGEMLSHHEFVLDLIKRCQALNIHTAAESSGFAPYKNLFAVASNLNMLFFDIKHIDPIEHKKITGQDNILILDNLQRLVKEVNTPIHIRLPLIPGYNDDAEHLAQYGTFISSLVGIVDLEVLPYHRLGSTKYTMLGKKYALENIKPQTSEELKTKVEILREHAQNVKVLCTG